MYRRKGEGDNVLEIVAVAHEIRGYCPVYKVGDKIVVDDPEMSFREDRCFMHTCNALIRVSLIQKG